MTRREIPSSGHRAVRQEPRRTRDARDYEPAVPLCRRSGRATRSKQDKVSEWLWRTNKDDGSNPLRVLGRLTEEHMDQALDASDDWDCKIIEWRAKFTALLREHSIQYSRGGHIRASAGISTQTLEQFIRDRELAAIEHEFDRATQNIENEPREPVSAASNILESAC